MSRKLATIREIAEIKSIPGADVICAYRVDGWWVVDKVGAHSVGDRVIYAEPDSWVPHTVAPFLTKPDQEPREYQGVKGQRLRTVRLRKQLSQGLLLPITDDFLNAYNSSIHSYDENQFPEDGYDCSQLLGITLWEAPIPACLAGDARGNFPTAVPKTEATRIQNLSGDWPALKGHTFEVSEKLHGSSCTMYLDMDGDFHVCSRNLDIKPSDFNSFWRAAVMYDVEKRMRDAGLTGYALQGELVGEGLNGNQYKLTLDWFVYSIYSTHTRSYLDSTQRLAMCNQLGLKHVPVLGVIDTTNKSVAEMLTLADGASTINGSPREGLVLKSQDDTDIIIKVISNTWLLKND